MVLFLCLSNGSLATLRRQFLFYCVFNHFLKCLVSLLLPAGLHCECRCCTMTFVSLCRVGGEVPEHSESEAFIFHVNRKQRLRHFPISRLVIDCNPPPPKHTQSPTPGRLAVG